MPLCPCNIMNTPRPPPCDRSLLELSLDGSPVAGQNGLGSSYHRYILQHLPGLHHLDLKRVTNHDQAFPLEAHNPTTNANNLPTRHPHTKNMSLAALGSLSSTAYNAHKNGKNSSHNSGNLSNSSSNNSNSTSRSNNHNSKSNGHNSSGSGCDGGLPVLPNTDSGMQQHRRKQPSVSSAPPAVRHPYNWPPSETSKKTNSSDARRPKTSDAGVAKPRPPGGGGGTVARRDHCSPRNGQPTAAFQEGASEQVGPLGSAAVYEQSIDVNAYTHGGMECTIMVGEDISIAVSL